MHFPFLLEKTKPHVCSLFRLWDTVVWLNLVASHISVTFLGFFLNELIILILFKLASVSKNNLYAESNICCWWHISIFKCFGSCFYSHTWKIEDNKARVIWIITVIMLNQTKYLCNPNNFFLFSSEHIPFIQPRLNEQVNIRKIKDTPAKMPLQNTSVCPRIKVVILITQEYDLNSALFSRCQRFYCK